MKAIILFTLMVLSIGCKTKNINYIEYYNKTHSIDSVFRFQKDTLLTIKLYKKHFRNYGFHNQERLRELETYFLLCHYKGKKFGGKKSLYKLIDLITPFKQRYKDYSFFEKYGIDSLEIASRYQKTESNYNKILIDSFSIALVRDQEFRKNYDKLKIKNADLQNIQLLKWTLQNYGFPSLSKVGSVGNWQDESFYSVLFIHFCYPEEMQYLRENLLPYIKSGECNPYSYAAMVDRYCIQDKKTNSYYYARHNFEELSHKDSIIINKRRRSIGLPSLFHTKMLPYDRNQILIIK